MAFSFGFWGLGFLAFFHRDQHLTHGYAIARADVYFCDGARNATGHFNEGFVGFEFDYALIDFNYVALGDEHADNIAGFHAFAEIGELKFSCHEMSFL